MAEDTFGFLGQTLDGKYRVDEVVGEGGFGVVYRGEQLSVEREVAIKCLKVPAHFTADARELFHERFQAEGKMLAGLGHHPAVTNVVEFGVTANGAGQQVPYLVLEWLEGRDVEKLLEEREEAFDERAALTFLRPAIEALAFAHERNLAHRDVKPANLFLAETPLGEQLKVLDFGIAKAMQEGETATQIVTKTASGFSAFSPHYGAPEQFRSKTYGSTGPWTDVHALGLVLAEMVAGRAPFEGYEMADFYEMGLSDERPTPRALGADVSDAFEQLCAVMTSLDPRARFADASALLRAIDCFEAGKPFEIPKVRPKRKKKKKKRKKVPKTVPATPLGLTEPMGGGGSDTEPMPGDGIVQSDPDDSGDWDDTRPSSIPPSSEGRTAPAASAATNNKTLGLGAALIVVTGVVAVRMGVLEPSTSETQRGKTVVSGVPYGSVAQNPGPTGVPFPIQPASAKPASAKPAKGKSGAPADLRSPPADSTLTASGLRYKVLERGTGTGKPTENDTVLVHYEGWAQDGSLIDSSRRRGQPSRFELKKVIKGWTEGIQLMSPGDRFRFWIPANLAYGDGGGGRPGGMLVFDIALISFSAGGN